MARTATENLARLLCKADDMHEDVDWRAYLVQARGVLAMKDKFRTALGIVPIGDPSGEIEI